MAKSTIVAADEQVEFRLANGKEATANFEGGDISGLGGMIFMALTDDAYGFIDGAAKCIKDKRARDQIKHQMHNLLRQVVYLCGAGYPDGIDSNFLRKDPMLKLCLGWEPDGEQHAASQSGVSRMMTERSERDLKRLFSYFIQAYIKKHKKPPKEIELDMDGMAIEAHGRQQFISFNGYYEINMYFPLFLMDGNGWLIAPILRPGHVSDAGIAVGVLKLLVKRLRRAWPSVRILVRGDSAFNDPDIMDWCEGNNVDFVLGLKSDSHLNVHSQHDDRVAEQEFEEGFGEMKFAGSTGPYHQDKHLRELYTLPGDKRYKAFAENDKRTVRRFGEFRHRAGEGHGGKYKVWKKERRVISLSKVTDRGLRRRYLATSLEGYTPDTMYNEIYSARGKAELVLRSIQALGASRLNSQEAMTNQFRLIIYGLTYNLLELTREQLPETLQQLAVEGLIRDIIRIPVQVKVTTRRIWLRWSSAYPFQKQILKLSNRLNVLPKPA